MIYHSGKWVRCGFSGGELFLWKGSLERDPQVMCKNMLVAGRVLRQAHPLSSLRNKRPDLSGRPPCKGVAIGVARRGGRLSGERTLRVPPSCSFPVSHSGGPHVASFVRRSSVRAGAAGFRKEAASCACGVLAAGARARRGAGGELQRPARRREATTAQAKNA